jgi:hypothetical protein
MATKFMITDGSTRLKRQIEFLLGKEIPLSNEKVNSLAHLTTGNSWVLKVLDELGLTIDDIIYEQDREILRENNR